MFSFDEMYWAAVGAWYWLKAKIRPKKYCLPPSNLHDLLYPVKETWQEKDKRNKALHQAFKDRIEQYRVDRHKSFIATMQDQVSNSKPKEIV